MFYMQKWTGIKETIALFLVIKLLLNFIDTYSGEDITLTSLKKQEHPDILQKIYKSCAKKQNKVQTFALDGAPNCRKYTGLTPEGYTYIYFENNELDSTLLKEVRYTKFDGLVLLPPYSGTSFYLEVGPGQDKIVLIKQIDFSGFYLNCSTRYIYILIIQCQF